MASSSSTSSQPSKEAAEVRGEAKALTKVGTVGAAATTAGWLAFESGLLVDAVNASTQLSKKGWRNVGIAAATASLGALIYAGYRHSHADKLEAQELNESLTAERSKT